MQVLTEKIFNSKSIIVEDATTKQKKYYLEGITIQSNVINKNKRNYPDSVISEALDRYFEKFELGKHTTGCLDHPSCFTASAKILTVNDGWKYIKDTKEGELVFTLNIKTKNLEIQPIKRVIAQKYNGPMLKVYNRNINTIVTPNHKFPLQDRYGKVTLEKISDIFSKKINFGHHAFMRVCNEWEGIDKRNKIVIKGVDKKPMKLNGKIYDYRKDLEIDVGVFAAFMGIWLSEGGIGRSRLKNKKGKGYVYRTVINQKKEETVLDIRNLISKMNGIVWTEYKNKIGVIRFSTGDSRLYNYLKDIGKLWNKYIPHDIKQFPYYYLNELIEWFMMGDGRNQFKIKENQIIRGKLYNKVPYRRQNLISTAPRLINDLHECLLKTGRCGNICIFPPAKKDYMFGGHIVTVANKKDLIQLNLAFTKNVHIGSTNIEETQGYDDYVYCVETQNHTFYAMDNNRAFWSGNSTAHDSDYVNPKEVSHLFTEIKRDGDNWYTKSFVMDTPNGSIVKAFIDAGAVIGVSTRGSGDYELNEGVQNITSYDFITLGDYVTDPSAPSAYLNALMERKEWLVEVAASSCKGKCAGCKNCKCKVVEAYNDKARKELSGMTVKNASEEAVKFFTGYFNLLVDKKK